MDAHNRHMRIYRFLWHIVGPFIRRIFRIEAAPAPGLPAPYLVLANHNLDLDPALVGLSFPQHMYFVASEHVFRKGWISKLLRAMFAPISRMKGATDAQAALDIIRALRRGSNVCLFAEGNRSFSGVTGPISPATGKLAKAAGVSLITYRLTGGYLTKPRWARTRRRGRMTGTCVRVYTTEELKTMTPEEVNAHIAEDLFEDAFLRQSEIPVPFYGQGLAEGLETALFLCPQCGGVGTLRGKGDRFICRCGLSVRYTVYGFFEGADVPFSCVRDWDVWQAAELEVRAGNHTVCFSDPDTRLFAINKRHRMRSVDKGTLTMDGQALTLGSTRLPLDDISDMAVIKTAGIMLTAAGRHYEIRSRDKHYCGRKYFLLQQIYSKKR